MDAIPTEDTARYVDMFGALGAECRLRIVRLLLAAHPRRRRSLPSVARTTMPTHWGIEDPAAVEGSDIEKEARFRHRVQIFEEPHFDLH